MIVGNGLIAKAFYENYANNDDVLIFASGVSNSSNTDPKEFLREKTLLESHLAEQKKIVYFSTCSIEDPSLENSPYILHKLKMEELVKGVDGYLIFRLPQLAGKTDNPNTLLNFLYRKIKNQEFFEIYSKATRNIIDIDDAQKIMNYIIGKAVAKNDVKNVASPIYSSIQDLVGIFEDILGVKARCNKIQEGSSYTISPSYGLEIANYLNIEFGSTYVKNTLKKYYGTK
jgi:nucleoside-diphosphate-sugar epimerase